MARADAAYAAQERSAALAEGGSLFLHFFLFRDRRSRLSLNSSRTERARGGTVRRRRRSVQDIVPAASALPSTSGFVLAGLASVRAPARRQGTRKRVPRLDPAPRCGRASENREHHRGGRAL